MTSNIIQLLFVLLVAILRLTSGVRQEVTFYTDENCRGESITFLSSKQYLSNYGSKGILQSSKSISMIGYWVSFNYYYSGTARYWGGTSAPSESRRCFNSVLGRSIESIRHLGSSETTTPAISLYSGIGFSGTEYFVEGSSGLSNLPDPVYSSERIKSYTTTGKSSWTFYTGSNFDGTATCQNPGNGNVNYVRCPNNECKVGSVARGCGVDAERNILNLRKK